MVLILPLRDIDGIDYLVYPLSKETFEWYIGLPDEQKEQFQRSYSLYYPVIFFESHP